MAAAVFEQLLAGTLMPGDSDLEESVGQRLASYFPRAEHCRFLKTGSEAVSAAIRLARCRTHRRKILRVGFHGWHDGLIDPKIGWHNWDNVRTAAPHVEGALGHPHLEIDLGYAEELEMVEARIRNEDLPPLAAIVLDPIQLISPASDLRMLARACHGTDTLLVLDETKTALRVALGGVQELYGVAADITIAGKALANGLPLASVLGPADLLQAPGARIKGTFSRERAALAAALVTLDVLEQEDVCHRLATTGRHLIDRLNAALREAAIDHLVQAVPYRWSAMPHLHAATDDQAAQECRRTLVDGASTRGVLLLETHNSFVCAAHTPQDVERTAEALHDTAEALSLSA